MRAWRLLYVLYGCQLCVLPVVVTLLRVLQVKVLYVKGLMPDVTEDMLKEKFEPYGAIERCRKVKDYAFIHFTEREHCLQVNPPSDLITNHQLVTGQVRFC